MRSNALGLRLPSGILVRYAHMNIETIDSALVVGAAVKSGQALARTGCTWNGRRSQTHDPHLHVGFHAAGTSISPYPFLVEAYLRAYDDPVLAVAGGYAFTVPGGSVDLDGSRSVARPAGAASAKPDRALAMRWVLHDGRIVEGPRARAVFDRPGLYSEELRVRAAGGGEDRDFLQVRVYDPFRGSDIGRGWIYHAPVRGIRPGTPVLFWHRLNGNHSRYKSWARVLAGYGIEPVKDAQGNVDPFATDRGTGCRVSDLDR
jgi:hypothetical protein